MVHSREWIEWTAQAIEALAVLIMAVFIAVGSARWLFESRKAIVDGYTRYRIVLGRTLLVGLELLVAADIIRTVALEATLLNMATLAVLVVVRTFLSWSVSVEVEGRWPWQGGKRTDAGGKSPGL